jgi:hypothetical protein
LESDDGLITSAQKVLALWCHHRVSIVS